MRHLLIDRATRQLCPLRRAFVKVPSLLAIENLRRRIRFLGQGFRGIVHEASTRRSKFLQYHRFAPQFWPLSRGLRRPESGRFASGANGKSLAPGRAGRTANMRT